MPPKAKFVEDAGDDRLDRLARALFHESGVDGVYARTGLYEGVVEALTALISSHRPHAYVAPSPEGATLLVVLMPPSQEPAKPLSP